MGEFFHCRQTMSVTLVGTFAFTEKKKCRLLNESDTYTNNFSIFRKFAHAKGKNISGVTALV